MNEKLTIESVLSDQGAMFGFSENENVKNLELAQLSQSVRVEGKHGRVLLSRPVQSWNVIAYILELMEKNNVNYKVDNIFVQKRNSFPMLNDEEKALGYNRTQCPINRWLFDKVLSSIQIPGILGSNGLTNAKIGFGFSDEGIEIAFGMNVHVCQNFSILGGCILRTFKMMGKEALSWEAIEIQFRNWIENIDQLMKVETEIMLDMMGTTIQDDKIIDRVVGSLYQKAIDQAYISKQIAPFDTAGMSNFTQNILRNQAGPIRNVWDLYNYGTAVMKPGMVDIADLHASSSLFAEYLLNEFEVRKN